MLSSYFETPPRITGAAQLRAEEGPYPVELTAVLSPEMTAAAQRAIRGWPGYEPTPLRSLDRLAGALGLGAVLYKDESARFGLGSFKALGGAYAVLRLLADRLEAELGHPVSLDDIRRGRYAEAAAAVTVVTATDGNHGRSVAWGAQLAGCRCRIYIHAEVSEGRKRAMEAFGADVVRIDGDYDASVHFCADEAAANGWFVVSDTSYEGYSDLPRQVMAGYTLLAAEVLESCGEQPPNGSGRSGVAGGEHVDTQFTAFVPDPEMAGLERRIQRLDAAVQIQAAIVRRPGRPGQHRPGRLSQLETHVPAGLARLAPPTDTLCRRWGDGQGADQLCAGRGANGRRRGFNRYGGDFRAW